MKFDIAASIYLPGNIKLIHYFIVIDTFHFLNMYLKAFNYSEQ